MAYVTSLVAAARTGGARVSVAPRILSYSGRTSTVVDATVTATSGDTRFAALRIANGGLLALTFTATTPIGEDLDIAQMLSLIEGRP